MARSTFFGRVGDSFVIVGSCSHGACAKILRSLPKGLKECSGTLTGATEKRHARLEFAQKYVERDFRASKGGMYDGDASSEQNKCPRVRNAEK